MKKILFIDPDKCSGCRLCEVVCSFFNEGEFNPSLSRITVVSIHARSVSYPLTCEQCERPLCVTSCAVDALRRDSRTDSFYVDADRCVGCRLCVAACPIGAISIHPEKGIALKCNLCKGEPRCVQFCPVGAIEFLPLDKASAKRKITAAAKIVQMIQYS